MCQQLELVRRRAGRRLGRTGVGETGAYDAQMLDAMARELYVDRVVGLDIKRSVFPGLFQVSPGGLLALAWLCRDEKTSKDLVSGEKLANFSRTLVCGAPLEDALNSQESVEVVESILRHGDLGKNGRAGICVRLLASTFLSTVGRSAALERIMTIPAMNNERKTVFLWGMGLDVQAEIARGYAYEVPLAPASLARSAIMCLVACGEECSALVRHVLTDIDCWPDPQPVLQGILDVVEKRGDDMQAGVRRQALDVCVRRESAALRRRAYSLAVKTGNREFLQMALKDPDFSVRGWALRQKR